MNDIIASVGFHYDQTEYNKFEKIYWRLTQKKSYMKFQLITLAMLIIPGVYFAISYWIFVKSTLRKTRKAFFKDHEGGVFQHFSFYNDGFNVKTEFYDENFKYRDYKFIAVCKGYLAFYHINGLGGYCVPIKSIENYEKLHELLVKLPNFIEAF